MPLFWNKQDIKMQIAVPHTAVLDVTNKAPLIPSLDIYLQDVCSMYRERASKKQMRGMATTTPQEASLHKMPSGGERSPRDPPSPRAESKGKTIFCIVTLSQENLLLKTAFFHDSNPSSEI